MPVIQNQIWKHSPVLYRVFKPSKEGAWGLALPSYNGRKIAEPLEYEEVSGSYGAYKTSTTWSMGTTEVLSIAEYDWRMYYVGHFEAYSKELLIGRNLRSTTPGKVL